MNIIKFRPPLPHKAKSFVATVYDQGGTSAGLVCRNWLSTLQFTIREYSSNNPSSDSVSLR